MNRKVITGLIAGGVLLGASGFAFARRKAMPGASTDTRATEGITYADGSVTLPDGTLVEKNRKLYSNQEMGTPMVLSPSQVDDVALQKYKGEFLGIFTGKSAVDRRYFPEGMKFLQVQFSEKSYWVSVHHVKV